MARRNTTASGRPNFDRDSWMGIKFGQWVIILISFTLTIYAGRRLVQLRELDETGFWRVIRDADKIEIINIRQYSWPNYISIAFMGLYLLIMVPIFLFGMAESGKYEFSGKEAFYLDIIALVLFVISLTMDAIGLVKLKDLLNDWTYKLPSEGILPLLVHYLVMGMLALCILLSFKSISLCHRSFLWEMNNKSTVPSSPENPPLLPNIPRLSDLEAWDPESENSPEPQPQPQPQPAAPALTREEVIRQRIEAVSAPPSYFYATSNRVSGSLSSPSRPETRMDDADEILPLYHT